jgi:hypothetical protein
MRAIVSDREIALMALREWTTDKLTRAEIQEAKAASRKVLDSGWRGLK